MDGNTVLLFSLLWTSANITVNRKKDLKMTKKRLYAQTHLPTGRWPADLTYMASSGMLSGVLSCSYM